MYSTIRYTYAVRKVSRVYWIEFPNVLDQGPFRSYYKNDLKGLCLTFYGY